MVSNMTALTAKTKFIRLNITGFQNHVTGLEKLVTMMEDHLNTALERDQEFVFLRNKVIDLEDRSQRGKARFFGIPKHIGRPDVKGFLRRTSLSSLASPLIPLWSSSECTM
ncbi:hypothetical protein NDU88_007114 [Pleurodeles waltl]|uniref:Uncharacterized protein n=1 Tax=Pleurodeles waltl TaxID=8319 RepID=A0AAV7VSV9_PLEWA|nr:hypothetical protein NDU88_007114 [Pleurodeles waltl]